jgi:hypothetical protein
MENYGVGKEGVRTLHLLCGVPKEYLRMCGGV